MFDASHLGLLAQGLAVLFGLAALLHLAAPKTLRAADHRSFVRFLGVLMGVTALFLAVPLLRLWGGVLGGALVFSLAAELCNRSGISA